MSIIIVVAMGENREIGHENQLLWKLPADMKFFRTLTTGHTIIMGRKTHESIGKALPNRRNIVFSKTSQYFEGCEIRTSLKCLAEFTEVQEPVFLIGGAELYAQGIAQAAEMYITKVHASFQADAFFPEFSAIDWELIHCHKHPADEKNAFALSFCHYKRR
jgi:dihydrofolate reductase